MLSRTIATDPLPREYDVHGYISWSRGKELSTFLSSPRLDGGIRPSSTSPVDDLNGQQGRKGAPGQAHPSVVGFSNAGILG